VAIIESPVPVDSREVAKQVKAWFDERSFETKAEQSGDVIVVKARKKSTFRAIVAADRAIEVAVRNTEYATHVDVRQGSWKTNIVSNTVWFVATGGAGLLISGWSLVIQRDLESHIRGILAQLGGTREIQL
jgi:phage anti-repressor protein